MNFVRINDYRPFNSTDMLCNNVSFINKDLIVSINEEYEEPGKSVLYATSGTGARIVILEEIKTHLEAVWLMELMTGTKADKPNTISVFSIDENTDGIEYYSEKDKQTVKIAIYDKSIGFV